MGIKAKMLVHDPPPRVGLQYLDGTTQFEVPVFEPAPQEAVLFPVTWHLSDIEQK